MFFLYAVPLSLLPPVMLHFSGIAYGGRFLLPTLSEMQLQFISLVFFVAELAMTFLVAYVIQRLGELVDISPPSRMPTSWRWCSDTAMARVFVSVHPQLDADSHGGLGGDDSRRHTDL